VGGLKIPLNPPLRKGETGRGNSNELSEGCNGAAGWEKIKNEGWWGIQKAAIGDERK